MKLKHVLFAFVFVSVLSCDNDDSDYEFVQVATPQIMSKTDFRKSVKVKSAQTIEEAGKIYAYKDYIFIGDVDGVHIINNVNPERPTAIAFIEIPKNEDISVKDNYLYADSATDLLVFDISSIHAVTLIERLEDVFDYYDYEIPVEAQAVDYNNFNYNDNVIVGWTVNRELRKKTEIVTGGVWVDVLTNDAFSRAAESVVGVGGSLARFQIVDNYLYTVGNHQMSIFNINNLETPVLDNTMYAGWNIETMFQADGYLYLGSTNGMYIYGLTVPSAPQYISEFTHWEGCDPVVVDGDYAYLTLRGGNQCGQLESVLEVIDISDKSNPTLAARYTLENPYGLGIKDDMLFVCDGTAGLKLFDKTNPLNIQAKKTIKNIQSKDVIPLYNSLLMIGDDTLYQYEYLENDVRLISTFSL